MFPSRCTCLAKLRIGQTKCADCQAMAKEIASLNRPPAVSPVGAYYQPTYQQRLADTVAANTAAWYEAGGSLD